MFSLCGIIVSVAAFIGIAFIGYSIIPVSIGCAMLVALTGGLNPFEALTTNFMASASGFMKSYFIIFMFSAIFARIMGDSGAAASIAVKLARLVRKIKNPLGQKWMAVMCLPLINIILTYGGVNTFVVVFLLVSIARKLFKELDVPWWMYTNSFLGSATITVGMLPGTPQMANLIPGNYFGTDPMAAPMLGIVCAIIGFAIGTAYIWFQTKRNDRKGYGFFPTGELIDKEPLVETDISNEKPLWACLLPMLVVFIVLNVLKLGAECALLCGIVVGYITYGGPKKLDLKAIFVGAAPQGIMPLMFVSCASGFGGVVKAVPGFTYVTDLLMNVGINPFTIVLIINVCAGICGSSSSGENIALQAFSDIFMASGIPAPQLHRLVAMSSIGLDTLPHCSGVISGLSTTKLTHKQAYINILAQSVLMPIIVALIGATFISLGWFV